MTDDGSTQESQILRYLKAGKSLTPLAALNMFGSMRLGARIYNLRAQGYKIKSRLITLPSKKRVAVYELAVQ